MGRKPTLSDVVAKGDLRDSLEALRDRLAAELDGGVFCKECGGAVSSPTAPLAKQLSDVLKALAALPTGKEESLDDDLARRNHDSTTYVHSDRREADTGHAVAAISLADARRLNRFCATHIR